MASTIYDGTFTGTATTAGGAGTTTGVADTVSVGTANAWTDVVGGAYYRDGSGNLTHNSIPNYTSQTILTRPSGEACNDQSVECQWTWDGTTQVHVGPILRKNGGNWYWPSLRAWNTGGYANTYILHQFIGSTVTYTSQISTGVTWVSGHRYRAIWKVTGFSPSTISLTVYDLDGGSPGTPICTGSYTDNTSGLQTAGTCGFMGWDAFGTLKTNRVIIVNEAASSPATGYSLSGPSTCTVGSPSTNFTVTLTPSGGTSSGVTITPSDGGGGGTFTPTTVSLSTGTPSATFTYTAGSSGTKTISTTNSGSLSDPTSLSVTASTSALTMGALSVSARTTTSITVGWSAATGGTGTKTYALYRYSTAPFTPPGTGTLVGSTTSTSLTDSSPGTGDVYYRVIVTDGASSTSISTQSASQTALITRVVLSPIVFGLIGDSITYNMGSAAAFISLMSAQEPRRSVTLGSNRGVSGTTSTDWLPVGGYLSAALSDFATNGVTHVLIMLGTNDSRAGLATSASTYASNITAINAACVAAGLIVVNNAPPYLVPGTVTAYTYDEPSATLVSQYRDALPALANGTTVFMGDDQMYDVVSTNPSTYLSDGIHYNSTGNTAAWNRWAAVLDRVLYAAPPTGVTMPIVIGG